jgi:hypothetical protein
MNNDIILSMKRLSSAAMSTTRNGKITMKYVAVFPG